MQIILDGSMRCSLTMPVYLEGVLTHSPPPLARLPPLFPRTWVVKAGSKQIIGQTCGLLRMDNSPSDPVNKYNKYR